LPADHKVSVAWQIVFTFIPFVNFWAFYRIRKLRKYLLFVVLPVVLITSLFAGAFFGDILYLVFSGFRTASGQESNVTSVPEGENVVNKTRVINRVEVWHPFDPAAGLNSIALWVRVAFQAFAIYLVIKWSREHNLKFTSPAQTGT
jgi:hypothetical protein